MELSASFWQSQGFCNCLATQKCTECVLARADLWEEHRMENTPYVHCTSVLLSKPENAFWWTHFEALRDIWRIPRKLCCNNAFLLFMFWSHVNIRNYYYIYHYLIWILIHSIYILAYRLRSNRMPQICIIHTHDLCTVILQYLNDKRTEDSIHRV